MSKEICISCRQPKASLNCELCEEALCSKCDQFLEEKTFSFLGTVPPELSHTHYCTSCYTNTIEPALESYNEVMERAKLMYFFFDTQRKPIPVTKRAKDKIHVENCPDRDETILRLAFMAAQQKYSAVIEAEITSKKVRMEGWQTTVWQGTAVPAFVDVEKLQRSEEHH
jgi:hypothetical protein